MNGSHEMDPLPRQRQQAPAGNTAVSIHVVHLDTTFHVSQCKGIASSIVTLTIDH